MAATVASTLQIVAARPCLSFSPAAAAIQGSNSKRLSWGKPTSSCNIFKFNKLVTKAMSESSENKSVHGLPIDLKDKFSCCFLAFVAEILVGTWLPLNPKMSNYTVESSTVETPDGVNLRTRIFKAKQDMKDDNMVIVLVHPYSIMGGCQALMKGIASGLAEKGYSAVTFDMRGVGRSTGKPSLTGFPEVADVVSVCKWVSRILSSERILLLGSSAGAPIAGSAVDQIEQVVGYVSLGYPFGMMASILFGLHHKAILQSPKPKLFVMGTEDGFTSVSQLNNKLKSAAGQNITRLLEGVSHFEMEGPDYDAEMVNCILEFISSL